MIVYLIKVTFCAALFLLIYCFLLEKERMNHFKRFYLLFSLIFSMTIPFVDVQIASDYLPAIVEENIPKIGTDANEYIYVQEASPANDGDELPVTSYSSYQNILLFIYISICSILLFRYIKNITQLLLSACRHKMIGYKGAKLILIEEEQTPHSFMNYIYVNRANYEYKLVDDEILIHELVHVRQKHSLDVLFIELLLVFFWFNPVFYIYRNRIKLNHEFLADEKVVKDTRDAVTYQYILLKEVSKKSKLSLASNFNYLITKKRFVMMTKKTSKKKALCKGAVLLPVFLALFCILSVKTVAGNIEDKTKISNNFEGRFDAHIIPLQGVSQEKIDEYKRIVGRYFDSNNGGNVKWKTFSLSEEDWQKLYVTYIQMNKEQRNRQLIAFQGPLTPFMLRSPNEYEWQSLKNPANNEIWINGKQIQTSELDSYNPLSFVFYLGKRPINNGKNFRADMWTKEAYNEFLKQYEKQIPASKLLEIRPVFSFVRKIKKDSTLDMP